MVTKELQHLKLRMGGLAKIHKAAFEAGRQNNAFFLSQGTKFQKIDSRLEKKVTELEKVA